MTDKVSKRTAASLAAVAVTAIGWISMPASAQQQAAAALETVVKGTLKPDQVLATAGDGIAGHHPIAGGGEDLSRQIADDAEAGDRHQLRRSGPGGGQGAP